MKKNNKKKFKKVVKYYYPNGDKMERETFLFFISLPIIIMISWVGVLFRAVLYPIFYFIEKDGDFRYKKEVYWEEKE